MDVVTFDHEHVPQDVLAALVDAGVAVRPGPAALGFAQDKLVMRARLAELGMPQPDWAAVTDAAELQAFLDAHDGRAVVKTPRGGYDGKGVRVVAAATEADDWFAALAEDARGGALLVEELVDFSRELAQQVARRPSRRGPRLPRRRDRAARRRVRRGHRAGPARAPSGCVEVAARDRRRASRRGST